MAGTVTRPVVLVTGGAGHIGCLVAERYLRHSDLDVLVHVRSGPNGPTSTAGLDRVHRVAGDLADDDPFGALERRWRDRVTHIIHAAAVTRFDVSQDVAERVNVGGTEKVLALARRCPRLQSVGLVSTVYSAGLRTGVVAEEAHDGEAGFANWYEWSKWRAEGLFVEGGDDLPWRILRLATVVADDDSGRVTRHNAFHETLKLCFHGLLSLLPGHRDTPLYLVTGDLAARAMADLMDPSRPGGVYHVSPARAESLTLGQVLDAVFDQFEQVEEFRRKRILRPLLADEESFDVLVEGVSGFGGTMVSEAIKAVAPFARQLYAAKDVDNTRLRAALGEVRFPNPAQVVRRTCARLVETGWGRRSDAVA